MCDGQHAEQDGEERTPGGDRPEASNDAGVRPEIHGATTVCDGSEQAYCAFVQGRTGPPATRCRGAVQVALRWGSDGLPGHLLSPVDGRPGDACNGDSGR